MAKNTPWTGAYEALPKIAKIIIQVLLGAIVGGVYRIVKYFETKNIITLVVGLLGTFTGIGNVILWICDVVTTITRGKFVVFAD